MSESGAQQTLDALKIPGMDAPLAGAPAEEIRGKQPKSKVAKERELPNQLVEAKAKFDELLKASKEKDEPKRKAERKAKAKEDPMVFEEPDDDEAPKGAQALAPVKAEPKEEPKPKDAEAEKLRSKLLLAGHPKKAIESLSDSEVGEWWTKQEERERAQALSLQRASEAERKLQEATKKEPEPQTGVPTDSLDLDEAGDALMDQFGEDEGKALLKVFSKLVAPLQQENAQIKAILKAARDRGIHDISARNRDRLSEKLPSLKENDALECLHEHAVRASEKDPSKYPSAEAAYDDTFQLFYGDVLKPATPEEPAKPDESARDKARIQASAVTQPTAKQRERKFTELDASKAAFRHLFKHPGDVDGAKRSYANMNV
jgi:hypothetical protein